MNLRNQHQARNVQGNGITDTNAMALEDLMLQYPGVFFRNAGIRQDAETCIDAINSIAFSYYLLYVLLTLSYPSFGFHV